MDVNLRRARAVLLGAALTPVWVGGCGGGAGASAGEGASAANDAGDDTSSVGEMTEAGSAGDDSPGGEDGRVDDVGGFAGPFCDETPKLRVVYFVESDQVYDADQHAALEVFAFSLQSYVHDTFGGTFYLSDPVVQVIDGVHEAQWYVDTPDGVHGDERWYRLGNIMTEVYGVLGLEWFAPLDRVLSYPVARYDGRVGANFGGGWMDGDDLACTVGANGGVTWPYEGGVDAHCMGHPMHELGHVFGLDHEGPDTDCMQFGFYNNSGGSGMCSFSAANIAKVLDAPDNAGWLDALPGDTCVTR